jgi:iron(III) transport system ATP-binding protein
MSDVLLEGVSRSFGAVPAVDRIDLVVAQGEFVTLLGPSGCGKTTTLRMVAGLEQVSAGRITIGGRVVSDAAAGIHVASDHRRLGMVFQSYAIWPHMTVRDNVAYPLRVRRRPRREIEQRVMEALRLVEMESLAERPAPALSGGQQQRVAIARALVFEPSVLLLDEPLSNLDARLRSQMGGEFRALQRRLRITTLYVTHDQDEALALSDRVLLMQAGKVLQEGAPEDIYQRPRSVDVAKFFGAPNILAAEVRSCEALDGGFRLAVEAATWKGFCRAAEPFAAGSRVQAIVRPEHVQLDEAAPASAASWRGRIVEAVFHGATRVLEIETGAGRMRVEANALRLAPVGAVVRLSARETSIWAVPAS